MVNDLMIFCNYELAELKNAFAKSLKALRLYVGYSLVDLEKITGIDDGALSRYENAKVEPSLSQAVLIAETFLLSIEDFILFGLNRTVENSDSATIIERFNETLANEIAELGINAENIFRKLYPKVDIDGIIRDYL